MTFDKCFSLGQPTDLEKNSVQSSLNQNSCWNGRKIGIVLVIAGSVAAAIGALALFGGYIALSAMTAKVCFYGGLAVAGTGLIVIIVNHFCLSKQDKKPEPDVSIVDLDKAILEGTKEELRGLITQNKLNVDKKGKNGISYIQQAILEREKDVVELLAKYSKSGVDYTAMQIDIENWKKLLVSNLYKLISDESDEIVPYLILVYCPIVLRSTLFGNDPDVNLDFNLNAMLKAASDDDNNNFWHELANPLKTPDRQNYLYYWLVPEAKDKLMEKNKDGYTPIDIACRNLNVAFIKTLADPTNLAIDWTHECFKSVLQDLQDFMLSKLDKSMFQEDEEKRFNEITEALTKCVPYSMKIEVIDKKEKRLSRTANFWKNIKPIFQNPEELVWARKIEEKQAGMGEKLESFS